MVEFCKTLASRSPHIFIIEEVLGFCQPCEHLLGLSPAKALAKMVRKLGYGIAAVELDHALFIDMARPRVWLIGVHADSGGQSAADWIADRVTRATDEIMKFNDLRRIKIFDVVDENDPEEIARRRRGTKVFLVPHPSLW